MIKKKFLTYQFSFNNGMDCVPNKSNLLLNFICVLQFFFFIGDFFINLLLTFLILVICLRFFRD